MRSCHVQIGRLRRWLLAIATAALAAAVTPGVALAAETGVVSDFASGVSSETQDRTARALLDLDARWVRVTVNWSDAIEPSDDSYNGSTLSSFDRAIKLARAVGYKVIVMVNGSPSWARDGDGNSPPRDSAELGEFMAFLASRYVGQVEAYQVWNEPNVVGLSSGMGSAAYARMLRTVAPSIRAADPTAKVVFAGLFRNDYGYLARVYRRVPNVRDSFDVMATHPYVEYGRPPEAAWLNTRGDRISRGAFSAYRAVRETMETHGDAKPIWLTGFAWSTTTQSVLNDVGVSPAVQADYLVRAYRCLEQDPYVQIALWSGLRNDASQSDADTWTAQLGLMTTDFMAKPAYYALWNYEPGAGGCTYDDPFAPAPVGPPPGPTPEPETELTHTPKPGGAKPEDDDVPGPAVRSRLMLTVTRARIRKGRLTISGRVARGATGRIRGQARFGRGLRRFTVPIESGRIKVNTRLRDARHVKRVRVTLIYRGSKRFQAASLTLRVSRRQG